MKINNKPGETKVIMALKDYVDGRFYLVTGVYAAISAMLFWHGQQLASRYERELRTTTSNLTQRMDAMERNLSGRMDNIEVKLDGYISLNERHLVLVESQLDLMKKEFEKHRNKVCP